MSKRKDPVGVVFPILPEHIVRLFDKEKDVFVKFTKLKRVGIGSRIIFYISGKKVLACEGTIAGVERLDPQLAWIRYGERMFLNQEEYDDYVERSPISKETRKMKEITIFVIKDLKRYKKPIKTTYPITPAGCYLTSKENIK